MIEDIAFTSDGRSAAFRMRLDPDVAVESDILTYLRAGTLPEPELVHLLLRVLKLGDSAVDGGANVGFFTLLMASLVGIRGRVCAFEPDHRNVLRLRANCDLNEARQVDIVEAALWNHRTQLRLGLAEHSGNTAVVPTGQAAEEAVLCRAVRLDDFLRGERFNVVKLDIEGAELKALWGGERFLRPENVPFVVVELNQAALARQDDRPSNIRTMMQSLYYTPFVLDPGGGLPAQVPETSTIEPRRANSNILFSTPKDVAAAWSVVAI